MVYFVECQEFFRQNASFAIERCVDRIDIRILEALQRDSRPAIADLADTIGLSASACHRRVRALEEAGMIRGYVAELDADKLGIGLHAFVEISLASQSRASLDAFEAAVGRYDDILECYLMAGAADYMLRVAASNLADFDDIHRRCLAQLPGVSSMRTSFSIRRIKRWAGYRLARA